MERVTCFVLVVTKKLLEKFLFQKSVTKCEFSQTILCSTSTQLKLLSQEKPQAAVLKVLKNTSTMSINAIKTLFRSVVKSSTSLYMAGIWAPGSQDALEKVQQGFLKRPDTL